MLIKNFLEKYYQTIFWLLPSLLAFCCFINTLGFDFVYDDFFHVTKATSALGDWSRENLKCLFTSDFWTFLTRDLSKAEQIDSVYYRPFLGLVLMVNYTYAGVNPWVWHLTSVLLHVFSTFLAYKVVLASLKQLNISENEIQLNYLALISACIFAVHPIQTESVAWVSAYASSLLAILIFTSLLAYFQARNKQANFQNFIFWLLTSVFFYSLALLVKEIALLLALLLFCYEILFFDREVPWPKRLAKDILIGLPFFFVTVIYFILRIKIIGAINPGVLNPDFPETTLLSRSTQIFTLPTIILSYIKNLVLPFSLSPMYPIKYIYAPEWASFYLLLLILSLIIILGAILSWQSLVSRLGFIWLIVPLLPVLDIRAFKPEDLMHDRYLYFSVMGAGILLGQAVLRINLFLTNKDFNKESSNESALILRPSLLIILSSYLFILMLTTIKQNYVWADEWQLWTASREAYPKSCMANKELGRLSAIQKNDLEAIAYYEQAKLACPNSADVYLQLGGLYGRNGNLDKAEKEFKKMITLAPYPFLQAEGYFNLGLVYQLKGDKAQAILQYQKSLELEPTLEKASKALEKLKN